MLQLARAIVEVLSDLVKLAVLFLRPASAIRAENLALRRQLAAYIERGVKPRGAGSRRSGQPCGAVKTVQLA
jgi:hypothetical protein